MTAPKIDTRKQRELARGQFPPALPRSRPARKRGPVLTIMPTDRTRPFHHNPYVGAETPQPLVLSETSRTVAKLRARRAEERKEREAADAP